MNTSLTEDILKKLSRENFQKVILEMAEFLSEEQCRKLEAIIAGYIDEDAEPGQVQDAVRMSDVFANEKMTQIKQWMEQIDEGELYLETEEYEDYSSGYWDSEWIVEYYDRQDIGDKLMFMIQFAKDCVDDRRYEDADLIYEWLWHMSVSTASEYSDSGPADIEILVENDIIGTDIGQLALLTLYTVYQVSDADERAENIYGYFTFYAFRDLHIEDMFSMGRENLSGLESFWKEWTALLREKSGDMESRLLQEAVLRTEGIDGLVQIADENCKVHPSLYLTVMEEYNKNHDYEQIEKIGEKVLTQIDVSLVIRGEMALKAAYASFCLMHTENVMKFCWECFRSDSNSRNFLRLFGTKEMAERYGMRGKEVLFAGIKGNSNEYWRSREQQQNTIGKIEYQILNFYMGDFEGARQASKNPQGSLGWSGNFINYGIRLFLLYLYERPLPSKAAECAAAYAGFRDDGDLNNAMSFESEIIEESRRNKTSVFWSYFKRWKSYFPMEAEQKKKYLTWAGKIIHSRADAIVGGQHRGSYGEAAQLLALVAEVREDMGMRGAKNEIFAEYKRKFPRHSSFQAEMRTYFGR